MSGLRNVREAKFFHKNSHYMDLKKKKPKKPPKILVKIKAKLSSGMNCCRTHDLLTESDSPLTPGL